MHYEFQIVLRNAEDSVPYGNLCLFWDDVGIVPYELHTVKFCVFTDSRKGCPYDLPPRKQMYSGTGETRH